MRATREKLGRMTWSGQYRRAEKSCRDATARLGRWTANVLKPQHGISGPETAVFALKSEIPVRASPQWLRSYRFSLNALVRILVVTCLWPYSSYGADARLSIDTASALPNYELTRDDEDLAQLSDGKTTKFPIWTNRASVGWQNKTPLVLKGRVLRDGRPVPVIGLNVETAKGEYAAVYPPVRIDIYCGSDQRGWRHAASSEPDARRFPDRSAVTLPITFESPCTDSLAMVFNFLGAFLMLDEIIPVTGVPTPKVLGSKAVIAISTDHLVSDSRNRLNEQLKANQIAWLRRYVENNEVSIAEAWLSQPWSALEMQSISPDATAVRFLEIAGSRDWSSDYVVGILNGSESAQVFRLAGRAKEVTKREVLVVLSVLAGNGKTVFDPLRPLTGDAIQLPPRSMTYLLIRESASESYSQVLTVTSDRGFQRELQVDVEVLPGISDEAELGPAVVAWSYLSDAPIWQNNNTEALMTFLRNGGVNVFVVHPSSIPLPGDSGAWGRLGSTLSRELQAYRGSKAVLLYLAWDDRLKSARDDVRLRTDVKAWTARLVRFMAEEGYRFNEWAVYPVDEPKGEDYELIAKVGRWIKEQDARVRIYSNPGQVSIRDVLPGSPLQSAAPFVDIWQPLVGAPAKLLRPLITPAQGQEWWIYQVGRQPAKAISPECYRKLGWEAARSNATGFGFWSFSDTGRSSAWDDYDGVRPDWAVVYEEADGTVTSSRRWEALRQGIRDYRALKKCRTVQNDEPIVRKSCERFESTLDQSFHSLNCE